MILTWTKLLLKSVGGPVVKNFDTIFFCLAGTVSFHDDFCMIVVKDLSVVRVDGDDGVEEEEVDVGDSGSVDGEEEEEEEDEDEDDEDSESVMDTDQRIAEFQFDFDDDENDSEDDLQNLFRSIDFHDAPPDPMTCSKSRLATVSYSGRLHTFVCLLIPLYVCLSISRSEHISPPIPFPLRPFQERNRKVQCICLVCWITI